MSINSAQAYPRRNGFQWFLRNLRRSQEQRDCKTGSMALSPLLSLAEAPVARQTVRRPHPYREREVRSGPAPPPPLQRGVGGPAPPTHRERGARGPADGLAPAPVQRERFVCGPAPPTTPPTTEREAQRGPAGPPPHIEREARGPAPPHPLQRERGAPPRAGKRFPAVPVRP